MDYKFIVLEGADGSGKTALAAAVARILADRGVQHVSRRQTASSQFAGKLTEHLAEMLWNCGDATELPDTFWLHTQAAWFIAHATQVVAPALRHGPVIVDGWYYKLWSKLLEQGYTRGELGEVFARVPRPDQVILLDVEPATLWRRRKDSFRPTELGMHAGYAADVLGEDTFLEYQAKGMANFRAFAEEFGWQTLTVPTDQGEADTAEAVAARVGHLLDALARDASGTPWIPETA